MKLLMLGPTAGKGTQAAALSTYLNLPHISTGDIYRTNIEGRTSLGAYAATALQAGELVPDSVTKAMLAERFRQRDIKDGFVLDGFPHGGSGFLVRRNARRGIRHRRSHRSYIAG